MGYVICAPASHMQCGAGHDRFTPPRPKRTLATVTNTWLEESLVDIKPGLAEGGMISEAHLQRHNGNRLDHGGVWSGDRIAEV